MPHCRVGATPLGPNLDKFEIKEPMLTLIMEVPMFGNEDLGVLECFGERRGGIRCDSLCTVLRFRRYA